MKHLSTMTFAAYLVGLNSSVSLGEANLQGTADAAAQPDSPQEEKAASDPFKLSAGAGLIYQFDADIDGGGDFNAVRLSGARSMPTRRLAIRLIFRCD